MKTLIVAIFTSLPEEVAEVEEILKKSAGNKILLIASTPEAETELVKRKIDFIDSSKYYPGNSRILSWQKKVLKIGSNWYKLKGLATELTFENINIGKAAELGFHIYLSEVIHSLLTAQDLLDRISPDIVFCNPKWPESPFRRYQTENLNLESLSLWLLAKQRKIKVFNLGSYATEENRLMLLSKTLVSSIFSSIRNINSEFPNLPAVVLGNHYQLKNLEPTLIEFIKDKISYFVTGKTSSGHQNQLRKMRIPFFPFISNTSAGNTVKFLILWKRYKAKLDYYFTSFHPLFWYFIEPKLWWYFINEFPSLLSIAENCHTLFGTNTKVFITMATADHFSRTLALSAKSKGIKVIELQHGLYLTDVEYPFRDNDYFLIWSKQQREQLYDGKDNPGKYPIAGYPWFNQYFDQYKDIKTLKHKNIKTLFILILANFPRDLDDERLSVSESPFQFMTKVFTAVSALKISIKVIFRPHPSCQARWVIPLAKYFKIDLKYDDRSTPLIQSISNSDLVIANFTTAVVDAMFVGRPILISTFHKLFKPLVDNFDATKLGAWKIFKTTHELETLIHEINSNKKYTEEMLKAQKKFLKKQVVIKSESAAAQIVKLLRYLMK